MAKSKKQRVLDIHASNPDFLTSEIAFRADCAYAYVTAVLANFNCDQAADKPAVLRVNLPVAGTELQVHHRGKLLAVLLLTPDGLLLQTIRSIGKQKPVPWKTMLAFQKLLE